MILLLRIVRATTTEPYRRSEAAWNNCVHSPLLELVHGSDPWDLEGPDADQLVVARFEAVMGATIVGAAIPFIKPPQLGQPALACSVSLDSLARSTNADSASTVDLTRINITDLHSRSESKKVDYVLVMYMNEKRSFGRLFKTILLRQDPAMITSIRPCCPIHCITRSLCLSRRRLLHRRPTPCVARSLDSSVA